MGEATGVARQFGTNLRKARRRADLSQEEVGVLASLHRTEIGLLERGARVPRIDTLIKIAAALGIRIDCALLHGISWTPATTEPGAFNFSTRAERHAALMERAAKLREGQSETVDAVKLINEGRDELGRRGLADEPETDG